MRHGRSGHLFRTIILVVAVVVAFIVVSAVIRYNRKAGLFDSHKQPAKAELSHIKKRIAGKVARLAPAPKRAGGTS